MVKYLTELGVKEEAVVNSLLFHDDENESRKELFESQRAELGFDERETWDLRYTSACWLYQHIKLYKELGGQIVDLTFYKFKFQEDDGSEVELTQVQAIDKILELLETFIKYENKSGIWEDLDKENEEELNAQKCLCKAFKMYGEIIPAMWW